MTRACSSSADVMLNINSAICFQTLDTYGWVQVIIFKHHNFLQLMCKGKSIVSAQNNISQDLNIPKLTDLAVRLEKQKVTLQASN